MKRTSPSFTTPPAGVTTWADFRAVCWLNRPCWICNAIGECKHREPKAVSLREFWRVRRANLAGGSRKAESLRRRAELRRTKRDLPEAA
jgi:hypothetical protein